MLMRHQECTASYLAQIGSAVSDSSNIAEQISSISVAIDGQYKCPMDVFTITQICC